MQPINRVKEKIQSGQVARGFICRTLSPAVVELIGLCGLDFVWIDMEHSTVDFQTVEHLCRAADAADLEALVRVPDQSPSGILRALEAGAGIVNVPQVEERAQVEAIVRAAKYHPIGDRGYTSSSRGTRYAVGGTIQDTFALANERVMTMVQIESVKGVKNAAEICSVPGLDAVFIGLGDLSQSLGVTGEMSNARVLDAAKQTLDTIASSGLVAAMHAEQPEAARKWVDLGARIVCCGVDLNTLRANLLRLSTEFALDPNRADAAPSP